MQANIISIFIGGGNPLCKMNCGSLTWHNRRIVHNAFFSPLALARPNQVNLLGKGDIELLGIKVKILGG